MSKHEYHLDEGTILNKYHLARIDRLNTQFQKVLSVGKSDAGNIIITIERDVTRPEEMNVKYKKLVIGKRGGILFYRLGSKYDYSSHEILDESKQYY